MAQPKYKELYNHATSIISELLRENRRLQLLIDELQGGTCDYCIHNDCLECEE